MSRGMTAGLILSACMAVIAAGIAPAASAADTNKLRVISDQAVTGFVFPESVGCDLAAKVLYVSQFGGTELKPAEKDGKGKISKVALDGKILEELVTDWDSGSLFRWSAKKGVETLASGFKGPADFCVVPEAKGLLVVVPDLPKSELRMIRLGR